MRDSRKLGHSVLTELGKLNQLHKGRVDEANFARPARAPRHPVHRRNAAINRQRARFSCGIHRQYTSISPASKIRQYRRIARRVSWSLLEK